MSVDWETIKNNGPYITVNPDIGYKSQPRALNAINTSGWESTPSINWQGNILTYSYSPVDQNYLIMYDQSRISGPFLSGFADPDVYPGCENRQEIYIAVNKNDAWNIYNAGNEINDPLSSQFAQQLNDSKEQFYFVRRQGNQQGIYFCHCLNGVIDGPTLLPVPINPVDLTNNPTCNPFLSSSNTLVFDNGQTLYFSQKISGESTNEYFPPTTNEIIDLISSGVAITEPWLAPDGNQLLLTAFNQIIAVFYLQEPTSSTNPTYVMASIEDAPYHSSVGNATMDKFGNIYFSYIFKRMNDDGFYEYDSDIYVLEKE